MDKHQQAQFLCESIEVARKHMPFDIETVLSEVFPDKPCIIVKRWDGFVIANVSVTADNKLYSYNHSDDISGDEFHQFSSPLIYPENYPVAAQ